MESDNAHMSQPPLIPPQGPAYPYGTGAPVAPLPVQPLAYGEPFARRPALITAIGVTSIIVAVISGLSVGVQGIQTLVMRAVSTSAARMAAIPAPAATAEPAMVAYSEEGISDAAQRNAVMTGFLRLRPLSATRTKQLDALISANGLKMFLFRGEQLNSNVIAQNISNSGQKFSDNGDGADFYVFGQGEVEVYDTHAVFRPTDGGEPVSASVEIEDEPTSTTEVEPAAVGGTGTDPAMVPNPIPTPPVNAPVLPAAPIAPVDKAALGAFMIERLLSLILAIYLFVIGIMTLRQSRSGARLHWLYAFAKIPLALLGGWATLTLWTGFTSANASSSSNGFWLTWVTITTALACIYPFALMIALRSRSVREYYNSITPAA